MKLRGGGVTATTTKVRRDWRVFIQRRLCCNEVDAEGSRNEDTVRTVLIYAFVYYPFICRGYVAHYENEFCICTQSRVKAPVLSAKCLMKQP